MTENHKEQYRTVTEFLAGVKVAKSFNAEPRFLAELSATLWRMRADFARYMRLSLAGSVLFQVSTAVVLAGFSYAALRWFDLPLPKIVVLVFLFMRVAPRFSALQSDIEQILTNLPAFFAMLRIKELCDREREEVKKEIRPPLALRRELRLEQVGFRYDDRSDHAIRDVSIIIPAGSVTAIIGPSGSGKSTVADILMGLLEPQEGTVRVDGLVLDLENRRRWRDGVAYVPQEVFLLHDTIAANLRIGFPAASEPQILEALRAANASEFVDRLPGEAVDRHRRSGPATVRGRAPAARAGACSSPAPAAPHPRRSDERARLGTSKPDRALHRSFARLDDRGHHCSSSVDDLLFADSVVALERGVVVEAGDYRSLIEHEGSRLSHMAAGERAASGTGRAGRVEATVRR